MEPLTRRGAVFLVAGMAMLFLSLSVIPAAYFILDDFSVLGSICTGIISAGMIVCVILFMSMNFDRRASRSTFYLMLLIAALYVSLGVEYCYWMARDIYQNPTMLNAVYHFEHMILPPLLYLFINYEFTIMDIPEELMAKRKKMAFVLMVAEAAMLLLNYCTGYAFYQEGMGYVNTVLIWSLIIPTVLLTLMCACLAVCHASTPRHRTILMICIIIPLVTGILSMPLHIPSFTTLAVLLAVLLIYGEIYMDRGVKILKNEATLTEHRVAMMVSRIEPDLLDDALTSIMNIEGNPPETVEAIREFKTYLSENISTISQTTPIPFTTELQHVKTYVDLEKLRFKSKVKVIFVTPVSDFRIPPMTLQMIVENAIKHGITQRESGGTVTVTTEELDDGYRITVTDDGVGFDTSKPAESGKSHVGLYNLSSRVRNMMGGTFEISSKVGVGTTAVVVIPKK